MKNNARLNKPIIDQHVIRASSVYRSKDYAEVEKLRKLKTLDKTHIPLIKEYKTWLTSDNLKEELKMEKDYTYYIDKLLFATGKAVKFRKTRKGKHTAVNN